MRVLIIILLLGFTACGPSKEEMEATEKREADAKAAAIIVETAGVEFKTVEYDHCQYIITTSSESNHRRIFHKPDCINPYHIRSNVTN